eukprot:9117463-Ditylum_brightwellii.AAC.1
MIHHDANTNEERYHEAQSSRRDGVHYANNYACVNEKPSNGNETGNHQDSFHMSNENDEAPRDLPR